jgi:hypothetical protein
VRSYALFSSSNTLACELCAAGQTAARTASQSIESSEAHKSAVSNCRFECHAASLMDDAAHCSSLMFAEASSALSSSQRHGAFEVCADPLVRVVPDSSRCHQVRDRCVSNATPFLFERHAVSCVMKRPSLKAAMMHALEASPRRLQRELGNPRGRPTQRLDNSPLQTLGEQ